MIVIVLVSAWALIEAVLAVAMVAHSSGRRDRPSLFTALLDWRV